jgi:cell pole-organizing protein PopZ
MADDRNEPSMDEILSSIKRIIADDDRLRPVTKRKEREPAPQIEVEDEVLELTEAAADENEDALEEVLMDDRKAQSLRHSFSALQTLSEPGAAPQIVRSGETSLEALTRDLLRPMLKDWLDTNLPPIVEAMVDREITRITKKG